MKIPVGIGSSIDLSIAGEDTLEITCYNFRNRTLVNELTISGNYTSYMSKVLDAV